MELKHYEKNTSFNEDVTRSGNIYDYSCVIPANTRLQIGIGTNDTKNKVSKHLP